MNKKKTIHSSIFQLKQDLLSSLRNKPLFAEKVAAIKNSLDYSSIKIVSRDLARISSFFDSLIYGNMFPESYSSIGVCNPYFIKPQSVENEILWVIHQIEKNSKAISCFSYTKRSVETKILLGYYEEALLDIVEFEKMYHVSLWTIEIRFIIYYLQGETQKVLELASEINKCQKNSKSGFVPYLSYMLYKRSNPKISAHDFDAELTTFSKRNRGAFLTDRYKFFEFKLNFYNSFENEDLSSILLMDSTNALIDRYDSLVKVLLALFVSGKHDRELLSSMAQRVYSISSDERLLPIVSFANDTPETFYDFEFIKILDLYYSGNYELCLEKSRMYLQSSPSNLNVLKIFCRSLLFLGRNFLIINNKSDSIINEIGRQLYNIMRGEEMDRNIYPLYQKLKNLSGFRISAGLYCFINEERNKPYNKLVNLFSSCCFDPNAATMFKDSEDQVLYIDKALNKIPTSKSLLYHKNRLSHKISEDKGIVACIRDVDNAKILFYEEKYDECIQLLKEIEDIYCDHIPVVQTTVRYIFNAYVKKQDYTAAIAYYVNEYIKDEVLVAKVDTSSFSKILHRNKYRKIKYNLDLLIFMFVSQQSDTARSVVLERFCEYKEVDYLPDLVQTFANEQNEKIEALVYSIVTGDVLRHTKLVDSTKQIMDIDNALLQFILQRNPIRSDEFVRLNEELAAEMIVYSGMRKVDDSLIYANVPAILKYELNDVEPLYEQFKSHLELSSGPTCYIIFNNTNEEKDVDKKLLTQSVHYTDSSLLDTSSQLFKSIIYPFLKSKFGVGTYLSTRIRHGVFETNLQSAFIGSNLMLQMENNQFIPNSPWLSRYSLSRAEHDRLFVTLSKLSLGINRIIQDFKSDVLQIRMSDEEKGGFDYRLTNDEICMAVIHACKNTQDFETFCYAIINYLWEVTNKSLMNIRNLVSQDLKVKFNNILDDFVSNTAGIGSETLQSDLSTAINNARTEVNLQLNKIERWFHLQDCKFEDFSFETHLMVVWNLIYTTHPSIKCELKTNHNLPKILISGEYGIHLSDLLHIFFANMINHSKREIKRIFILNASLEDNILTLHFENNFEGNEDFANNKICQLLQSDDRLQKEGGSGLVKARKIVKYDFGDEKNEVVMKIENGVCKADITINVDKLCVNTDC